MKKILLIYGALITLAASAAMAAGSLGLHVVDCHGASFVANPCLSDLRTIVLVGSAISPNAIPLLTGMEATVDLTNGISTLSPWWHMEPGGCTGRPAAITAHYDFTVTDTNGNPIYTQCVDFWGGAATGGVSFATPSPGPGLPGGSGRISLLCAIATPKPADAVSEYYLYQISILGTSSTGLTCPGCQDPVIFCVSGVKLAQPAGSPGGDTNIQPVGVPGECVSYNGGQTRTSSERTTWGSVKALYR